MGDVAGDRLGGASDGAVGDVSAADVVHGGGVGPVGVDSGVAVVRALRVQNGVRMMFKYETYRRQKRFKLRTNLVGASHGKAGSTVVGVSEPAK